MLGLVVEKKDIRDPLDTNEKLVCAAAAAVYVHGNGKLNIRLHNSTILTHIQSTMYTTLGNFKALNHVFKYPDLSITNLNLLCSGGSQTHMYTDTALNIESSRRKLTILNLRFLI